MSDDSQNQPQGELNPKTQRTLAGISGIKAGAFRARCGASFTFADCSSISFPFSVRCAAGRLIRNPQKYGDQGAAALAGGFAARETGVRVR